MGWKLTTLVVMAKIAFSMMFSTVTAQPIEKAPSITDGPNWSNPNRFVRPNNNLTIECQAEGYPIPKYTWLMDNGNGKLVEVAGSDAVKYDPTKGFLFATDKFREKNNNDFTCIAYNRLGRAMTAPIHLASAGMISFPGKKGEPAEVKNAYISEYVLLECKNANTVGGSPFTRLWQMKKAEDQNAKWATLTQKDNVVMDPDGHLHILWVTDSDFNFIYRCGAYFTDVLVTAENTHSIMLQKMQGVAVYRQPRLVYHSDVTAMAGTTAKLMCIFTYYSNDEFYISWNHEHAKRPFKEQGQVLNIVSQVPDEKQNVSGRYSCEGILSGASASGNVILTVTSPPQFIASEALVPRTVPKGSDAVFTCGTSSHDTYQDPPIWYVNTEKFQYCEKAHHDMICKIRNADSSHICAARCNGVPECPDEEDELLCGTSCSSENEKLCRGKCIAASKPCDVLECVYPHFPCKDNSACIPKEQRCDMKFNCTDRSDEQYCPGGDPISLPSMPFIVSSDRKTMTVPQVQMDDSMCFQCSVSNKYGTVYGAGCLEVIERIDVFLRPNGTYNVESGFILKIGVDARTDSRYTSKLKFNWIMYNETKDKEGNPVTKIVKFPFSPYVQYFQTAGSGKNLTIIIPNAKEDQTQDKYNAYEAITRNRKYALNVTNGFETVFINFTLVGSSIEKPAILPVVEAAATNLWLIALILAILILIVVVVLIVCYMHRNRGGTYPLDKKEHQAGHDPAQELKDNAFMDVGRVDDDDDDKPRDQVSLSDSIKYESDDDITGEYDDDINLDKYREEGSFIFQYGDKKKGAKEATV